MRSWIRASFRIAGMRAHSEVGQHGTVFINTPLSRGQSRARWAQQPGALPADANEVLATFGNAYLTPRNSNTALLQASGCLLHIS